MLKLLFVLGGSLILPLPLLAVLLARWRLLNRSGRSKILRRLLYLTAFSGTLLAASLYVRPLLQIPVLLYFLLLALSCLLVYRFLRQRM
ncbi:MAG: hypothetical protein KKI09_01200 [Spirochaetes bacterium]|nr:hypothetical protein [Spirochaetota bacterium]MBU0954018.1 hypothetical protein [Spirochaetota bacterium]